MRSIGLRHNILQDDIYLHYYGKKKTLSTKRNVEKMSTFLSFSMTINGLQNKYIHSFCLF